MKKKPAPLTGAERVARHREKIQETGGRQIAVMLTPEASEKLDAWISSGETIRGAVNRLLERSRPPKS